MEENIQLNAEHERLKERCLRLPKLLAHAHVPLPFGKRARYALARI